MYDEIPVIEPEQDSEKAKSSYRCDHVSMRDPVTYMSAELYVPSLRCLSFALNSDAT